MLPSTTSRVERNTADSVNRHIRQQTEENVAYFAENPHEIERRLHELDHDWDIERTLEANAAALSLAGITLGATHDKRWLLLPAAVTGFLLQHALQGWCPRLSFSADVGYAPQRKSIRNATRSRRCEGILVVCQPPEQPVLTSEPAKLS
ncbi:hypothetical protein [Modicisalibacter luteus]|uniref:hypothetical protein n=1 Tax=Modicisalibacter luteus TaxID=453962 RepID=UPI00363C4476